MSALSRPMRASDLAQVLDIERACFPSPWTRENFEHELLRNPCAVNRVLVSGDAVVAYASTWFLAGELVVNNVAVHPDHRRRGLARRLLEELVAEAAGRGFESCTLEVRPSNGPALALYRGLGFVEVGRRKNYYRVEGEDAIVMRRSLAPRERE